MNWFKNWSLSLSLGINKKCFWKASKVPAHFLLSTAALAIFSILIIEKNKMAQPVIDYQVKVEASKQVSKAFTLIRNERIKMGTSIDAATDPQGLGILGSEASVLTSKSGDLKAKQTTINPNWAAVFIEMFREARLKKGDLVAAGMSGSFPALNISFLIAAETYGLKAIMVSSLASSSYGANIPGLSWLEMEGILFRAGLIHRRSKAVSIGAKGDRGLNLPKEGIQTAHKIVAKEGIPPLNGRTKSELIQERLDIFQNPTTGLVKAYINIGGGVASVGSAKIKKTFRPGVTVQDASEYSVHRGYPEKELDHGLMTYFKSENIPVINMVNIESLARKYHLPIAPTRPPEIGKGKLYFSQHYSGPIVILFLLSLLGLLIWQAKESRKILSAS